MKLYKAGILALSIIIPIYLFADGTSDSEADEAANIEDVRADIEQLERDIKITRVKNQVLKGRNKELNSRVKELEGRIEELEKGLMAEEAKGKESVK